MAGGPLGPLHVLIIQRIINVQVVSRLHLLLQVAGEQSPYMISVLWNIAPCADFERGQKLASQQMHATWLLTGTSLRFGNPSTPTRAPVLLSSRMAS